MTMLRKIVHWLRHTFRSLGTSGRPANDPAVSEFPSYPVAETSVTLWHQPTRPSWRTDATRYADGRISICSGDSHREWSAIIAAADEGKLRQALGADAGDREETTLELLHARFGREQEAENPFEEIKEFLNTNRIPWESQVW